ncbi:MAG: hypothetical protein C4534_05425 [Gaiellales bacterium]|nr:MAG: hypothetical protein C4534_05425 [Gaiellales bacterium]
MMPTATRRETAVQGAAIQKIWLQTFMFTAGLFLAALLMLAAPAAAAEPPGAPVAVTGLVTGPGDQVNPEIDNGEVIYDDRGLSITGWIMRRVASTGAVEPVSSTGVIAGPAAEAGQVSWLRLDGSACVTAPGGAENCVALPEPAQALAFSGGRAVTAHGGKVIRLVNFETGRSKVLDSSTSAGNRFDPDVLGDRAVWVKERGYAGKYYEPLIVDYDLASDTYTYLTATGGGASSTGESLYERARPALGGSSVVYQQRIREVGEGWDLYRAEPGTYGVPLVAGPGDQVNPDADGDFVVYQDNRGGHVDETGAWAGEWDIYLIDLRTGVEVPVCTAAGDQVNPRVEGNMVVWQDNRSGDWDIYAAVVGASPDPVLTVRVEDVFWADFAAFQDRELTARYRFDNRGEGVAGSFSLRQVNNIPAEVGVVALPDPVDRIVPGGAARLEIRYHVPQGVTLFKTALYASCLNEDGQELWFPRRLPF